MKKLVLLAALLAAPTFAVAQDITAIHRSECTNDQSGNMVCSEPVVFTIPASTRNLPARDTSPVQLFCGQQPADIESGAIRCGHGLGNRTGDIVINLCTWSDEGHRTCRTTVSPARVYD